MFNPIIRGWINYYGHYYKSTLYFPLFRGNKLTMVTNPSLWPILSAMRMDFLTTLANSGPIVGKRLTTLC